ncbi:hypothetical protein C4K04_4733 [Pseudomonas chlororaphis]|uniref:Uncharacterized protein n=1 Tax=Pseudomonas chlororaphis TaxID=587753 RepID=A0A3G7TVG0_9PSED|nr:hypothetical protein C4K04_4733 [Pseudomonas chlororaphis]
MLHNRPSYEVIQSKDYSSVHNAVVDFPIRFKSITSLLLSGIFDQR